PDGVFFLSRGQLSLFFSAVLYPWEAPPPGGLFFPPYLVYIVPQITKFAQLEKMYNKSFYTI
ncbi:MAG: hypothetical protein D6722_17620, partial [Bacteroidetes bacterium]